MTAPRAVVPFAGCFAGAAEAAGCRLVFTGLADDSQSSFRRGAAAAPDRIRRVYNGNCYNTTTESGVDLSGAVADSGDLSPAADWPATARAFRRYAEGLFGTGRVPFFAGGDHAVTVPVAEALGVLGRPVHIIQIDAHPDLYPRFEGSATSHACVTARLLEMPHIASITQFGIRTMNAVQERTAQAHAGRLLLCHARELVGPIVPPAHIPEDGPVFLDVDLDGFDPAFAPGVSHPVPGGLTPRQVLDLIQALRWTLVGMTVVECNPELDVRGVTAVLAGRLLHEGMGAAIRRSTSPT
jgi:agmatinase